MKTDYIVAALAAVNITNGRIVVPGILNPDYVEAPFEVCGIFSYDLPEGFSRSSRKRRRHWRRQIARAAGRRFLLPPQGTFSSSKPPMFSGSQWRGECSLNGD